MSLVQIDKNIAWRKENQQKIVDYINGYINSTTSTTLTSTTLTTTLTNINGGDDSSSALASLSLGALLLTLY